MSVEKKSELITIPLAATAATTSVAISLPYKTKGFFTLAFRYLASTGTPPVITFKAIKAISTLGYSNISNLTSEVSKVVPQGGVNYDVISSDEFGAYLADEIRIEITAPSATYAGAVEVATLTGVV
jgi:hypothetical protein